jgi:hypothetical protein
MFGSILTLSKWAIQNFGELLSETDLMSFLSSRQIDSMIETLREERRRNIDIRFLSAKQSQPYKLRVTRDMKKHKEYKHQRVLFEGIKTGRC